MSTVNRNGGLGGLWPKLPKRDANSAPKAGGAQAGKARTDRAHFSAGTGRLAELAGDIARAVAAGGAASSLVRESQSLGDLIDKALARNLGRPVNLGRHREPLVRFVEAALRRDGYPSFDELKRKVG